MSVPFMQLYVADYLGDTRHLTTEQHGAYLLLLMTMWRAGGRLSADPKTLARIVGCTPSRWAKIGTEVMEFFDIEDGQISNRRLDLELKKAREKSIKRAQVGSAGGRAKALKSKETGLANATVLLEHSSDVRYSVDKSTASFQTNPDPAAWEAAVAVLTVQGRMKEPKARAFFGRLLSEHKLEARDLLPTLVRAGMGGTQDPRGYLTKAAQGLARSRQPEAVKHVAYV